MINFDGSILMDITSLSEPGGRPDGVDMYKHVLVPEADRYERICEGCGASPWNGSMFPMYDAVPITPESRDTMASITTQCQRCMDDLKVAYDRNPQFIAANHPISGAPWWKPVFVSGHVYGIWKEFSE